MCGIAGLWNRTGEPVSREVIERMTRLLAHRGPDGEGIYVNGPIGLGHRRLAVLDLSPAGAQPMSTPDGRIWITYNGEIFNVQELRQTLEARGYSFRSRTDTEVILYAYQEWGRACLARFNGMFAFALWDADEQMLWLVRDRLGVKPLFYSLHPSCLAFASEIKGLLPALPTAPALNEEALHRFLSLNYTPAPLTLFEGVFQLLPGQYAVYRRDKAPQFTQYWDIEPSAQDGRQAIAHFEALLFDAVRMRLVSDVEVGAFLSGGLDSSAVVGWMQRDRIHPVKTFTATFRDRSYNEAAAARLVASSLGTTHHEALVESHDLEQLPTIVWHSEELTADASMLALYRLAQRAREEVKVVLTGDGADELLGGYPTYLATRLAAFYRQFPAVLREGVIRPMVNRLPVSVRKGSLESRLRRFVNADIRDTAHAHASWRVIFSEQEKRALWKTQAARSAMASLYEPYLEHAKDWGFINKLLYADLRFYLPNDMLVKVDRMTMAWGLEARTPYLDYRLVEFAFALSDRTKCPWGRHDKTLLRRATRRLLPDAVRARSKAGFNIPVARWLKEEQRAFVHRHLLDVRPGIFAMFERSQIERLIQEHGKGVADHSHKLWGLLCLSLWWQQFMEKRPEDPTPIGYGPRMIATPSS